MKLNDDTRPSESSSEDDSLKELFDEVLENSESKSKNASKSKSQSEPKLEIEAKSNQTEPRRKWFDIIRVF